MPPGVLTVTSTVPSDPGGAIAEICVALITVNEVALVLPNLTDVAPMKLVPEMVTALPPVVGPLVGEIDVTVGDAA